MKKKFLGVAAAFLLLNVLSCTTTDRWAGVYTGVIPSASGEGISVKITLNADETYKVETQYVGKSDEIFTHSGTFTWNSVKDTIIIERAGDVPSYYKLGQNALIHLDIEGNVITGALANDYILTKQ